MLCENLGFIVESVQSGFPDCEAKRQLSDGTFDRVSIEFEYKSKTFLTHKHDVNICDIIVCWEHNWSECPLEVIELSTVVKSMLSH